MKRGHDFVIVERSDELAGLVPRLLEAPALAIDTESDSLYRYRERVCFLQIAVGPEAYIVDTLAVTNLDALRPVFEGPQLKIFHGADYDLSCLYRDFSIRVNNPFDTMIASQLIGREQLGLAALVREFAGVELDKSLTRHDWGERPLEDRHVRYLVDDVVHLTGVQSHIARELEEHDLVEEADVEFARLLGSIGPRAPFDTEGFRYIRGAHTLGRQALSILRELYLYRDGLAAKADKPPFKILGNHQLLDIAAAAPRGFDALRVATRMPDHLLRRFGSGLLDSVAAGIDNVQNVPLRLKSTTPRPPESHHLWTETLKSWRREASARDRRTTMAILPNHLLNRIAELRPTTFAQLAAMPLFGRRRLARYGDEILAATRNVTDGART